MRFDSMIFDIYTHAGRQAGRQTDRGGIATTSNDKNNIKR
jgi:hypothetical protein